MGKGRGAFQFLLCHSCPKITTGMKDHGLIQLLCCVKAKDYCILHGTLYISEINIYADFTGFKWIEIG